MRLTKHQPPVTCSVCSAIAKVPYDQDNDCNPSRTVVTIGLCFMVALMEGLDLQAAGIAAVGMAQAFALDKMQMGWIFSAGILGLLPGALVGGMLADRHGRKRILLGSVLLFGLFSLATALAWSFPTLLLARLLTGVGLGAALPNLIALTSEAAGSRFRGRAVSLMYCGVPIGAALAAALGFSGLAAARQIIFWIGGVVPLLLIPLLMRWLPESQAFQRAEASVPLRTLFARAGPPLRCCCGWVIFSPCWWSIC